MEDRPEPRETLLEVLHADARKAAKKSLRYKFGRLSNSRILGVLRSAMPSETTIADMSDARLLELWFAAFESARRELSDARQARVA